MSVPEPPDGQADGGPRKSPGWWPLGVLALVNLVDQFDQGVLRGVLPILEDEWGLSDLQLGMFGFAFIFMNVIATIPAGWVADRYRRHRIIGFTLLSWTGLVVMAATAVNYFHLLAVRLGTGIGHAIDDPAATSLISDYYPARQRGRAFSVQQVMLFVGTGVGLGLGGFIGSTFGWRWAFLVVGAPGLLTAILVFRLREPQRGEADDHVHEHGQPVFTDLRAYGREAARSLIDEMKFIFGIRTMRYILVGVGTLLFTVNAIGFWLAVYHVRYSGMTLTQATAFTGGVLALGGIIGTLGGGAMTDRVYGAGPANRITAVVWSIVVSFGFFLASFNVPSVPLRLFLQFVGIIVGASAVPGLRASMMDVVPARSRGMSASAFALTSAVFGAAIAPPILGVLSDMTSLLAAFHLVSPPVIIGALILNRAKRTIVEDIDEIMKAMLAAQAADQPPPDPPPPVASDGSVEPRMDGSPEPQAEMSDDPDSDPTLPPERT